MDRFYFKRLDYTAEDIPAKPYTKKALISNLPTQVEYISINDFFSDKTDKEKRKIFDFTKSDREKNCGLGDNYIKDVLDKYNTGGALRINKNAAETPIFFHYHVDKNNSVLYDIHTIHVEEGAQATIFFYYDSDIEQAYRNGLFNITIADGAFLKLFKVQNFLSGARNFESLNVTTGAQAQFEFYPIELGADVCATSSSVYIPDEWCEVRIFPLYFIDEKRRMDLEQNLIINGKNTLAEIQAKGALKDCAKKVVRGNIFLNRGCKRSIARFSNNDIMLSKDVHATSIPTVFCDEDDVIGEHAASFEAVDKAKLFYLMSRGIDKNHAKKMLAGAVFRPILNMIYEEEIKNRLLAYIQKKI